MTQRYGAGGVPYVGSVGDHDDSPKAEAPAEEEKHPEPEVKVEVTESEAAGDIPQG